MVANDLVLREPSVFIDALSAIDYSLHQVRAVLNLVFFLSLLVAGAVSLKLRRSIQPKPLLAVQVGATVGIVVTLTYLKITPLDGAGFNNALLALFFFFGFFAAAGLLAWIAFIATDEAGNAWVEIVVALFISSLGYMFALYAAESFSAVVIFLGIYLFSLAYNLFYMKFCTKCQVPAQAPDQQGLDGSLHDVLKLYTPTVLCIAALNFVLTSSRMLLVDISTQRINVICGTAICLAAVALFLTSFFRKKDVDMRVLYQISFPFIALAFLLLPLADIWLKELYMLVATILGTMGTTLLIYFALKAQQQLKVPAVGVYGLFSGFVHVVLYFGFIEDYLAATASHSGIVDYSVFALILVYAFLLVFMISRHRSSSANRSKGIVVMERLQDLDDACDRLAETSGLTPREVEILKATVQGESASHIADSLCISESTVRTHVKNIYKKLEVHSKTDLVNRVTQVQPVP